MKILDLYIPFLISGLICVIIGFIYFYLGVLETDAGIITNYFEDGTFFIVYASILLIISIAIKMIEE